MSELHYKQEIEDITKGYRVILFNLSSSQTITSLLFYNWDDVDRANAIVELISTFKMSVDRFNRLIDIAGIKVIIESEPISISEAQYKIETICRHYNNVRIHCISGLKMHLMCKIGIHYDAFKEV